MQLESLLQYLDGYLRVAAHPDYPHALNGLQVGGPEEVHHVVAAVDASEASISDAVARGADLILVHHGLFWGGLRPITGRLLRRIQPLLAAEVALYSSHLPLDSHPEVGNNALLGQAMGLTLDGRFASYHEVPVGWHGHFHDELAITELVARAETAIGGPVRIVPGGPSRIRRVGVVTGSGADALEEASRLGLDALVTGECSHHHFFDAMELGVHLVLGGHYATETFGVKALAAHVAERFGLTWDFIDRPTGL